ncbi:hypothetical protein HI200_RS20190 [Escherichia coli]|uniref:SH3 domain-containing protein n=4 Tax=Escherichia coli TaxID=562 RepID=A0A193LS30_ECOLX|nr:SH3 domain-containing protein [Escherichia coli]MCZ9235139.1 SH3 domain-containing protein [Escherichia albertii]ANO88899.1 hypothetical protein GJ11_09150 [Escherichia coli]EEQ7203781.1 SH3 domain-containing protein [Escherichia coli]EEQ9251466.1 SH3 domain-containing protein [Escherichia coli]EET7237950.1 SH3 domain-containing protein [Escherichia coli]
MTKITNSNELKLLYKQSVLIPSYKDHVAILQKQLGIEKHSFQNMTRLNRQAVISNSLRKQLASMPNLAGIGSKYREHIAILQKQTQALFPHDANRYIQMLRKQAEIAMPLRKQLEVLNKQAGLNNMQAILKELQQSASYKTDVSQDIKKVLDHYARTRNASLHQIIEQGISSIAQAYAEGATETSHTKSNVQNKGLNKPSSKFVDSFKELPYPLQWLLMVIFSQVVFGAFIDYGKEKTLLGIHKAESYFISLFEDKPISKQQLIKENKEISWEDLNGFRFITGENVRLHVSPSINSEVIECIGKNTIVAVLDKKDRQWLFVQVKSGDEFITGWITRTYTKPLKA